MRSPREAVRPSNNTTRPVATASLVSVLISTRSASRRTSPCSIWTFPRRSGASRAQVLDAVGDTVTGIPASRESPLAAPGLTETRRGGEPHDHDEPDQDGVRARTSLPTKWPADPVPKTSPQSRADAELGTAGHPIRAPATTQTLERRSSSAEQVRHGAENPPAAGVAGGGGDSGRAPGGRRRERRSARMSHRRWIGRRRRRSALVARSSAPTVPAGAEPARAPAIPRVPVPARCPARSGPAPGSPGRIRTTSRHGDLRDAREPGRARLTSTVDGKGTTGSATFYRRLAVHPYFCARHHVDARLRSWCDSAARQAGGARAARRAGPAPQWSGSGAAAPARIPATSARRRRCTGALRCAPVRATERGWREP